MKFSTAVISAAAAVGVAAQYNGVNVDNEILQFALTLEHLENNFYSVALDTFSDDDFQAAGYPSYVRQRIAQIGSEEATHVATLSAVLSAAGETPTEPCEYSFGYSTIPEFLAISRVLEGVGVSAYLYKASLITSKDYLLAAGAILTIEARHQALVSDFQGESGSPSPFDTPLQPSDVYTLAAQFIVPGSCPATNPTFVFQAFPALTVATASPQPGQSVSFTLPADVSSEGVIIHFLNGISDYPVELVDGAATLPAGVTGTIYAVATTTTDPILDTNTVAGPAVIILSDPNSSVYRRSKRAFKA